MGPEEMYPRVPRKLADVKTLGNRKKGRNHRTKTFGTTLFIWDYSNSLYSPKSHRTTNQSFRMLPQQA